MTACQQTHVASTFKYGCKNEGTQSGLCSEFTPVVHLASVCERPILICNGDTCEAKDIFLY
jgi:hypothetical protein